MRIFRSHSKREREKDRISELPEHLIHHIFSFLPIKYVVATSVLSKEWRYLWTSNPIIDFHIDWMPSDRCHPYSIHLKETEAEAVFMRFADRVLSFRQDVHSSSAIKKFRLLSNYYLDKTKINEWISTVLRHRVEEIAITDHYGAFPPALFTCESLTILEINRGYCLQLPESVYLPKLRILRLSIKLKNDNSIPKLLSNSPVLEELSLKVYGLDIQNLSIFSPTLKRLFINGYAESLYRNFGIQINTPNLQSFRYSADLAKDFVLPNFTALLDAEIVLLNCRGDMREKGELCYLAAKLFGSLSNVKRLTVSDHSLKLLSYQDHFQTKLPSFHSLIHLEVTTASLYHDTGGGGYGNLPCWVVGILLNFLHMSPNLESLIFADGWSPCNEPNYKKGWLVDLIPRCLLLHVKSIEFRLSFLDFWDQFDKKLVRFFLKNARVLQRVRIRISDESSDLSKKSMYKKKVLDQISLFPRGSADCVFHVS